MQNLIPVVIILGVLGFIVWKNWDKIKVVADKFKKPDPVEVKAPYKVPDPVPQEPVKVEAPVVEAPVVEAPVVEAPKVEAPKVEPVKSPTPEELQAQAQDFIRRATGWTEENSRRQDEAYARSEASRAAMFKEKGMERWDDQFPKSVPNLTVPNLSTSRHVIKLDKGGIKFLVFIPDPDKWVSLRISTDVVLWAGKFGNNPGHATIRDSQNNLVDERRLPLDGGIVFQFSPVDRKGCTKLERGTYEVSISYVGTDYPFVETYVDVIAK